MKHTGPQHPSFLLRRCRTPILAALLLPGLLACTPGTYVVLLANPDGSVGQIRVQGEAGTQQLSQAGEASPLNGAPGKTFKVDAGKLEKDFGAALAATAPQPLHFRLQFVTGGNVLTPESAALLPQIINTLRQRPAPDISVTGHTDSVGTAEANATLGLERARFVAGELRQALDAAGLALPPDAIVITSHGEANPLVPLGDEVDEPRNRRVEITVR